MSIESAIFLGLILSATSVSISAQTLMELKVLRSRVGISLLGAAVVDDVIDILGLSIFLALTQPGMDSGFSSVISVIFMMMLFLVLASLFGWWVFPRLSGLIARLPISQGLIAFAFVIALFFGWTAEVVGQMAAITGAFLAGLWLGRTDEKEHIHQGIATVAYGVFVPLFFVNIGLSANARDLSGENILTLLVLLLVAVFSKVVGSGSGAWMGGMPPRDALRLGVGMISRGEVGLIVATVGVEQGFIQPIIFSEVVMVVIITTILTPILLKALYPRMPKPQAILNNTPGGTE